ncbi:unnamed protein product [Rhodiola kirilowii]
MSCSYIFKAQSQFGPNVDSSHSHISPISIHSYSKSPQAKSSGTPLVSVSLKISFSKGLNHDALERDCSHVMLPLCQGMHPNWKSMLKFPPYSPGDALF